MEVATRFDVPEGLGSGYIEFPNPLTLPMFRRWWETAVNGVVNMKATDIGLFDSEYKAAVDLLADYGKVEIEGVTVGDLKDGNVHLAIASFIIQSTNEYITPFLPPKQAAVWSMMLLQNAQAGLKSGR